MGLAGLASMGVGVFLAAHHPLWPVATLVLFYILGLAFFAWPTLWLVLVPAALPWLNFSPWTGWLVVDEFDLLLLAVVAGNYARLARQLWRDRSTAPDAAPAAPVVRQAWRDGWLLALGTLGLLGLVRGLLDAGGLSFGWFQGYTEPLNSLRVFKSLLFGLAMLPLLAEAARVSRARAGELLALGIGIGLGVVVMAVLWERLAFPGLFDFSLAYRTTALFWEMHVGGAAIDAYLTMAAPFAAWGLFRARRPAVRMASAVLTLLTIYACISTFSRGVYLALLLPLLLLAGLAGWQRLRGPRTMGMKLRLLLAAMGLAVAGLVGAVFGPDTFMMNRLAHTDRAYAGRMAHWAEGLSLPQSATDWVLGLGLGRFPAHYSTQTAYGQFAGSMTLHAAHPSAPSEPVFMRFRGPEPGAGTGGLYALTQRVDLQPGVRYRVTLEARVPSRALLSFELCERHLLYERQCQSALPRLQSDGAGWQKLELPLRGSPFSPSPWFAPRLAMLSVSVVNGGGEADVRNLHVLGPGNKELLVNGDFSGGMARWFPAAQYYYLPWHADGLYLETLVERGLLGLVPFVALVAMALWRALTAQGRDRVFSTCLALALGGAMLLGAVSSLMDVPRIAFMLYLLMFFSIHMHSPPPTPEDPWKHRPG